MFNEKVYLTKGSSKLDDFIKHNREKTKQETFINNVIYRDNIQAYYDYTKLIAYLIKMISNSDNAISNSMILKRLIDDGVFSIKDFEYTSKKMHEDILGCLGINIIRGYGCCRHVSYFHKDVFDKMKINDIVLYCYIMDNPGEEYLYNQANHVMNLIFHDKYVYGYDVTRNELFKFEDANMLKGLYRKHVDYAYYKPYIDMVLNGFTCKNVIHLFQLFDSLKDNKIISFEEYKQIWLDVKDKILQNSKLVDEFKNDTKTYKKKIIMGLK